MSEPGRTPDVGLAEEAVLGAALRSPADAEAMADLLPAEDCFATARHQAVYAAIWHLVDTGQPVSPQSVLARLVTAERGEWKTGQAGVILAGLIERASTSLEHDARIVARAAARRRALAALDTARQAVTDAGDFDPEAAGDQIRALMDAALTTGRPANGLAYPGDLYLATLDRIEAGRPAGVVRLPWLDIRSLIPWLRPGQLVTFAARPSLGKSVAALDIARHVTIDQGLPAVLFTMEQDRDEVMDRILAAEAGVVLDRIIAGTLDDDEWKRLASVQERVTDCKLVIDDTPEIAPAHVRSVLRRMAAREPATLAIVDYLQLMNGAGAGENRQREVSALVSGLKAVAREFRIPVVMLCQLNRGPEHRADKRPFMSDARESGSVENDSDIAILIHRPDYYDAKDARPGEADLIVDKNRNGPRGTVTVGFQGHFARFVDLSRADWNPASEVTR